MKRFKKNSYSRSPSKVTPELASSVIKDYILPMFRSQSSTLKRRPSLNASSGTVYGSLKLTEEMSQEITHLKTHNQKLNDKLKDIDQFKHNAIAEVQDLKEKLNNAETNIYFITSENLDLQRLNQSLKISQGQLSEKIEWYTQENERLGNKIKILKQEIYEDKAKLDSGNSRLLQLQASNDILALENEIIGERLKGLHNSLEESVSSYYVQQKLSSEVAYASAEIQKWTHEFSDFQDTYKEHQKQYESLLSRSYHIAEYKEKLQNQRDALLKLVKVHVFYLQEQLEIERSEKTKSDSKAAVMYNKYKALKDKVAKMKAHQEFRNELRKKKDEQRCVNCGEQYLESQNYNWSCKFHKSCFSGTLYWCCGAEDKNKPGCVSSYHLSTTSANHSRKKQAKFCQNCKTEGHSFRSCDKDPNNKTRAKDLNRSRSVYMVNLHERMLNVIRVKPKDITEGGFEEIKDLKNQALRLSDKRL